MTGATTTAHDGALEVLATGPQTLVEDGGRPGYAAVGLGRSGAADRGALALANRLVGQAEDTAGLEVLLGGLVVRARARTRLALTGAPAPATVEGRATAHAWTFVLDAGMVLRLGFPATGLRSYLAVAGGIDVPEILGSRSSDTLSGIGPPPIRAGDLLPVGRTPGRPVLLDHPAPLPGPGSPPRPLTFLPGPRSDWATLPEGLTEVTWRVGGRSDRIGLRLTGATVPRRAVYDGAEVPSEGMVRGGIQLPPDGRPVVFLADHPVTGGYPVIAVLTEESSDRAAQLRPGDPVRLRAAPTA